MLEQNLHRVSRGENVAHHTVKGSYHDLVKRLNKFPQGAPPSATLHRILALLFTEEEARLVSLLPLRPFYVEKASRVWKTSELETAKLLDGLCDKGLLFDFIEMDGRKTYVLPPPMAGFFEFALMRVRGDLDQKLLSELYYQYLNVEEDFCRDLFAHGKTQLGRTFVHEPALSPENALHVLDYERATHVIESASDIGIGLCYCRHKMEHVGRACQAPQDICMTFNGCASSLVRHGLARPVDKKECFDLLQQAYEHKLVQFGENVQRRVSFICNCCSCCCEAMIAAKKVGFLQPVHTTNFIPALDSSSCKGCGKCLRTCPVEALAFREDPQGKKVLELNESLCLGCGLCVRECSFKSIRLQTRASRVLTPADTAYRYVSMALERGTLQNFIFDNQALYSHRVLAAILGALLKFPPVKRALANQQLKSRFVEKLLSQNR